MCLFKYSIKVMKNLESHTKKERDYTSLYAHRLDIRLSLSMCGMSPLMNNILEHDVCL